MLESLREKMSRNKFTAVTVAVVSVAIVLPYHNLRADVDKCENQDVVTARELGHIDGQYEAIRRDLDRIIDAVTFIQEQLILQGADDAH